MATGKEIRLQISSVKNTQKITHAMELVAASRIRLAQRQMLGSMPYSNKIRTVIGHVASSHSEFRHPYLLPRKDVKGVGYIIISSDRGLCGGLNNNLFRKLILEDFRLWHDKKIAINLCLLGKKAAAYYKHLPFPIVAHVDQIGPSTSADIRGAVLALLQLYEKNEIDRVYLVYNEYINAMSQKPCVDQILPLIVDNDSKTHYWDYIYEPDVLPLLDVLIRRYLECVIYQAIVDNVACEHAARMVAMKSATDNAGELISSLQLVYNKTRQASITREISEIVGGAEAV